MEKGARMADKDDFEEKLLEQLTEMFQHGHESVKNRFEHSWNNSVLSLKILDLMQKKLHGDVNFNFDLSQLGKMFEKGKSIEDITEL